LPQAERALELFIARINDPNKTTFGLPLSQSHIMISRLAECRVEIDAARLTVLNAAAAIDAADAAAARREIAEAKVLVPRALLNTLDRAIQAWGAAGVCQDTPLAMMWAHARTMRIVDGPDEVHLLQLGRNENKRAAEVAKELEGQRAAQLRLMTQKGLEKKDLLYIGKSTDGGSRL
jgi:acyl-CoA dehydrogenase